MSGMSSANGHATACDWQFEQYPWECNCGAANTQALASGKAEVAAQVSQPIREQQETSSIQSRPFGGSR